jgi:hypothetical protein
MQQRLVLLGGFLAGIAIGVVGTIALVSPPAVRAGEEGLFVFTDSVAAQACYAAGRGRLLKALAALERGGRGPYPVTLGERKVVLVVDGQPVAAHVGCLPGGDAAVSVEATDELRTAFVAGLTEEAARRGLTISR